MLQSAKTIGTMMYQLAGGTLSHNWKHEQGAGDRFLLVNGEAGVRPIAGEALYAPCGLPSPPTAR